MAKLEKQFVKKPKTSICDNPKTQSLTKLKTKIVKKNYKNQLWQNFTTQLVTEIQILNGEKTQKIKLFKKKTQ